MNSTASENANLMWQLYVLELENGCFYIGIALDVNQRYKEHALGKGANFTRLNKPIRIIEKLSCETCDKDIAYKLESEKTVEYALRYGGEKVKGGKYFIPSKLVKKVARLKQQPILS